MNDPLNKPSIREFWDFVYELTNEEFFDILNEDMDVVEIDQLKDDLLTAKSEIIKHPPENELQMKVHKILDIFYYRELYNGRTYI